MKENIFTREFIEHSNSDKARHVRNTLIKEVFVDSGIGIKVYQQAVFDGASLWEAVSYRINNDTRAQDIKLTYKIT